MISNFFQESIETAGGDEIAALQSERLRAIAHHVYANNSVIRGMFDARGVRPEDIRSVDDVGRLPLMSKESFRVHYPLAMCCVPTDKLAEMHMSSGSTGTPVVMLYTLNDVNQWAECMARCYCMAGTKPGDVVQITPGLGLFNGGFGCFHGARKLGTFIVPTGPGNTQRQITLAKDMKTNVIVSVVSYGIRIMEMAQQMNADLPDLKIGIFGAETFSPAMKERISSGLGIEVFDIYGMTETGGIGTLGQDCCAHNGIHVWEDHYIVEIIDPTTKQPIADGEMGELVITSITREAIPIIRFRTGDLTRVLSRKTCECGRTHVRLAPISGRVDDMLIIKGVNFFPSQVEQSLMKIPGVLPQYRIIVNDNHGVMEMYIEVEAEPGVTGHQVVKQLREDLGFAPDGDVFPPGSIPRQEGKAKRVIYKKDGMDI